MQFFPDYGYGLHRVLYVSRSLIDAASDERAMAELVAKSAANNRAKAVTGALLMCDGWFIQVLEGSRHAVKPLFDRIAADPRHTDLTLRAVDPIRKREFARWAMKLGRTPPGGAGFYIDTATDAELYTLLRLSTLGMVVKAA